MLLKSKILKEAQDCHPLLDKNGVFVRRSISDHACSCFYVVKAWKRKEAHDCNPKGYHVFVSFLIDL